MKYHIKKHKGKIIMSKLSEECQNKKLEHEYAKIKKLQDKVLHLELEQRLGFEEIRNPISYEASVGSPQAVAMEDDIMEEEAELKGH